MSRLHLPTAVLLVALPLSSAPAAEPSLADLLKLHTAEAKGYRIFLDESKSQELELQPKLVFSWTNLVGEQTQLGHLFVWTHAGRPEAIGTMFSAKTRDPKTRMLVHEFHTLSMGKLLPLTPEQLTGRTDRIRLSSVLRGRCCGGPDGNAQRHTTALPRWVVDNPPRANLSAGTNFPFEVDHTI